MLIVRYNTISISSSNLFFYDLFWLLWFLFFIDVVIGKSTEELCSCIVAIPREIDIELLNKSDRWVICALSVNQIQGDKHNVRLTLPKDVILIKPNAEQHVKVKKRRLQIYSNIKIKT